MKMGAHCARHPGACASTTSARLVPWLCSSISPLATFIAPLGAPGGTAPPSSGLFQSEPSPEEKDGRPGGNHLKGAAGELSAGVWAQRLWPWQCHPRMPAVHQRPWPAAPGAGFPILLRLNPPSLNRRLSVPTTQGSAELQVKGRARSLAQMPARSVRLSFPRRVLPGVGCRASLGEAAFSCSPGLHRRAASQTCLACLLAGLSEPSAS